MEMWRKDWEGKSSVKDIEVMRHVAETTYKTFKKGSWGKREIVEVYSHSPTSKATICKSKTVESVRNLEQTTHEMERRIETYIYCGEVPLEHRREPPSPPKTIDRRVVDRHLRPCNWLYLTPILHDNWSQCAFSNFATQADDLRD